MPDEKEKNRLINTRLNKYRRQVAELIKPSQKDELVEKTSAFVADPDPSAQRLEKLAKELVAAFKKARKPGQKKIMILVESMAGYWLDKSALREGVRAAVGELEKILLKAGLQPEDWEAFYRTWNAGGIY